MDMNKMMKEARKMQAEIAKAQEEAQFILTEATAGGGVVSVIASGNGSINSITIDPSVVDPEDVEMLQDLVLTAVNQALREAQELAAMRLSTITGGLDLPF
jgi:DNA-binding YbaB/EbfC family protein